MNPVVEATGGVRWQSVRAALTLIRDQFESSEEDAFVALKTWIHDGRVAQRGTSIGMTALVAELLMGKDFAREAALGCEVDIGDVHKVIASSKVRASRRKNHSVDQEKAKRWFETRVRDWPADKRFPTADDDQQAYEDFVGVPVDREQFRRIRRDKAPHEWTKKGPRPRMNSAK